MTTLFNYRNLKILFITWCTLLIWSGSSLNLSGQDLPDYNQVKLGAITYSWRNMSGKAEDVLEFCKRTGITTIEMMGSVAEDYAGIPPAPKPLLRGEAIQPEERKTYRLNLAKANEERRKWRIAAPMDKFIELRQMYQDAGVAIHIIKLSPARWTDEEIDYAFRVAQALGAKGITNEVGIEAAQRLAPFAEKHQLPIVLHNHTQPGEPGFNFDDYLKISPMIMLNFDVGHYVGATGKHPNEVIEKYHDRILSLHLKDKTSKNTAPPNTNRPWGSGDTPIVEILQLIQKKKWPIHCDIELEYDIPNGSDDVQETIKCLKFCQKALRS